MYKLKTHLDKSFSSIIREGLVPDSSMSDPVLYLKYFTRYPVDTRLLLFYVIYHHISNLSL